MGLSMYLEARFPIATHDGSNALTRRAIAEAIGYRPKARKPNDDPGLFEISGVTASVGSWGKCYPIHRWFVDNVQGGEDDCRPTYLSETTLEELEEQLDQVTDDPESTSECFNLDEDETLDPGVVDDSIRIVYHARQLQQHGWDIYYCSSW